MCYCYSAQCLWSTAWEQQRASDDLYVLDSLLKPHSGGSSWGGYSTLHHAAVSACRLEINMRKSWRTYRPTHLDIWRRWKPFLKSRRKRRGRGSAFSSKSSCPSIDTWMSPTMKGEQLESLNAYVYKLLISISGSVDCLFIFVPVSRQFTVSSTKL